MMNLCLASGAFPYVNSIMVADLCYRFLAGLHETQFLKDGGHSLISKSDPETDCVRTGALSKPEKFENSLLFVNKRHPNAVISQTRVGNHFWLSI